jgi:hypothetical protein
MYGFSRPGRRPLPDGRFNRYPIPGLYRPQLGFSPSLPIIQPKRPPPIPRVKFNPPSPPGDVYIIVRFIPVSPFSRTEGKSWPLPIHITSIPRNLYFIPPDLRLAISNHNPRARDLALKSVVVRWGNGSTTDLIGLSRREAEGVFGMMAQRGWKDEVEIRYEAY